MWSLQKFTPKLIEFRNKHSKEFEVIMVGEMELQGTSDYMKKYGMPWLAMENQSLEAKHASKVSNVNSFPFL